MLRKPERVSSASQISVFGVAYPAFYYRAGDQTFTVMFDRGTGLPARIRTLDYDNVWGDVTYDLVLADWQTIDDVRVIGDVAPDVVIVERANARRQPRP